MSRLVIYTDGGSRNNPGPAGIGAVIKDGDLLIAEIKKYLGVQTNNWAEYEALICALTEAQRLGFINRHVEVRMDSELIVKQMRGEYRVKDAELKKQHTKVRELMAHFLSVEFTHVRREYNKEADRLANEAMNEGTGYSTKQ